jgi:antirestriction protein ArdC
VKTAEGDAPPQTGTPRERLYQAVTDRMIHALEQGTVPWQKPWGAMSGWPRSMDSSKRYEGVNVLALGMTAADRGYSSPWWGTFPTIQRLGGMVMKGQNQREGKGSTTVMWVSTREIETDEVDPETGQPKIVGYSKFGAKQVFNAEQCEGLPERFYAQPNTAEIVAGPQAVLDGYLRNGGPQYQEIAGDRAYYRTDGSDTIVMPLRSQFRSTGHYYATAYHEATHSTGAPQRLNRPGIANFDHFGSGQYAREELVAQMGSALLVAEVDLDEPALFDNSVGYLQSWLGALKDDRSLVVSAASQAYRAVELIAEPTRQAKLRAEHALELEAGA